MRSGFDVLARTRLCYVVVVVQTYLAIELFEGPAAGVVGADAYTQTAAVGLAALGAKHASRVLGSGAAWAVHPDRLVDLVTLTPVQSPFVTPLIDELRAALPDVDIDAVLAGEGRLTPPELRRELIALGYDPAEVDDLIDA